MVSADGPEGHPEDVNEVDQGASSAINVFVTGQPGVGKTSLIEQVIGGAPESLIPARAAWTAKCGGVMKRAGKAIDSCLVFDVFKFLRLVLNAVKKLPKDKIAGFYTLEARNPKTGEKVGLDIETLGGERVPLSRLRRGCGPKVGKYYFALETFEKVVLPLLRPSRAIKLHVVDEVGRMELQSDRFQEALMELLASPQVAVFGSLPACRFGHDLPFVEAIKRRPDTAILTLTKSNRNATALQVEDLLVSIVGAASTPTTVQSVGSGSTTPVQKFACSSLSTDYVGAAEAAKSLIAEEPLEKKRKLSDMEII